MLDLQVGWLEFVFGVLSQHPRRAADNRGEQSEAGQGCPWPACGPG
jgi:hypothetical protein